MTQNKKMKRIKVGLNGFGRIGRSFTRIALKRNSFDIVAINTRKSTNKMLAYLLQYDSVYRRFEMNVREEIAGISIDGKQISTTLGDDPSQIPWEKYGVDVVIDATGAFNKKEELVSIMLPSKISVPTGIISAFIFQS